ncbi:MAG: peptidyl-prolyl cis-trans isomerase [Acidobacteriota bacterium]
MSLSKYLIAALIGIAMMAVGASAQETETKVVDEVVAQVNDGVITLSSVTREIKSAVDTKVQEGMKLEDAQKFIGEKRGELIANLINEELIIQKAKELGVDSDVDADINSRFVSIMKQYNLKTLDALYEEMRKQGADPAEIRELWRRQAAHDRVMQKEVQQKVYWKPSGKELQAYYEAHKAQFTKPATIGISELFLGFAGRDENVVREKAKKLVAELRAGADFQKVVVDNSDRPDAAKTKGKVDTIPVKDLSEKYAGAVKGLKAGSYTDPIEADDTGISILRVDELTEASNESQFDESAVRLEMMKENIGPEQKKFMATLRADSYIKINEAYRPLVSPILFADERADKPAK